MRPVSATGRYPGEGFHSRLGGSSPRVGAPIDTGHVVAGRYHLISALGNGGMGTVWLAEDDILSRRVAVKEVSPPAEMTEREREMLRERTLREARTAARLSHPNVVTIYDVVEDDGRPWIVMELIPSRSLRDLVEADGPLTVQQAAGVGLQILAALRAAHALGIMHRDVKPGNVLVDAGGRAVLADFGIARTQDSPALTTSGVLVGSPSYIAPERARGEPGGPESDLWSLGATLYALVEGRPAYDRAGALAILMAVVNEDPDPPIRAAALWPVIRGLLDHVPARRPGPDEAERMLREIADPAGGSQTAPFPVGSPAASGATVPRTGSQGSLESAEHTLTLRPWDAQPPPAPDARPDEPDPDALCDQPDPQALPDEPEPDALPDEPDPDALPDEPEPDALPDESSPGALPDEPDPRALPEEPGSLAENEAEPPPREPEPALLAEVRDGTAGPAAATSQDHGSQPEPGRAPEPGATATGPVPGLPGWFRPSEETRETRTPRRRKRLTSVAVAAAAVIVAAGVTIGMIVSNHHPALAGPNPDHSAHFPASSSSPTPSARSRAPTSGPPSSSATPAPTSGSGRGSGPGPLGPAVIPAGYHKFLNSTGFSIAVPNGWRVSHQGHYVYLLPPSGSEFLLIDQSDHPQPNPLQDWQQQEANRESTYAGYHRIRLEPVRYPQAEKAADWEFTYYRQGVLTHVLNRNILANAHHAYALYWSTPDSQWDQDWHIFKILARTFRPAAP
jgi:eukaryotic-like serine/threonine-protein kinase